METVVLPHQPEHPLRLGLFTLVQNSIHLRRQLLEGNADYEYAFLDATLLLSRAHLLSACFRAVTDLARQRLKTKNVHSEIVFAMSPNNNISESFRRFGIQDGSQHVIAIKVGGDETQVESHLLQNIHGSLVPLTDETLSSLRDPARISKVYRLDPPRQSTTADWESEAEAFIIGSIALRGS